MSQGLSYYGEPTALWSAAFSRCRQHRRAAPGCGRAGTAASSSAPRTAMRRALETLVKCARRARTEQRGRGLRPASHQRFSQFIMTYKPDNPVAVLLRHTKPHSLARMDGTHQLVAFVKQVFQFLTRFACAVACAGTHCRRRVRRASWSPVACARTRADMPSQRPVVRAS